MLKTETGLQNMALYIVGPQEPFVEREKLGSLSEWRERFFILLKCVHREGPHCSKRPV